MKITKVIDVGTGNIGSLSSALEKNNANFEIVTKPDNLNENNTSSIILPGVGSFPSFMKSLKLKNFYKKIKYLVLEKKNKNFRHMCWLPSVI